MAPDYPSGTYLIIEEWDKSVRKDDVVIEKSPQGYFIIARGAGVPGDTIGTVQVPEGEYFLSKDSSGATEIPGLVSKSAIIGKPLFNFGQTSL